MRINDFTELLIWKEARKLCKKTFILTNYKEFSKDFRLVSQIRASTGSIMDNIAEGFERDGNKEFSHYLYIAKGSCGESRSQAYRAFDFNYINESELEEFIKATDNISYKISKFIKYLKTSKYEGNRFKKP